MAKEFDSNNPSNYVLVWHLEGEMSHRYQAGAQHIKVNAEQAAELLDHPLQVVVYRELLVSVIILATARTNRSTRKSELKELHERVQFWHSYRKHVDPDNRVDPKKLGLAMLPEFYQ